MNLAYCERCGKEVPNHELISYTLASGSLELCTQCFNVDVAKRFGVDDFDNNVIDPISIVDAAGDSHTFHFQTRLMGPEMVVLEAFELANGAPAGYRFQMMAEPDEERFSQLGRLVQKIRRTLTTRYLENSELGLQIKDMEVRGHIEADMSEEGNFFASRVPMLTIDGRDISWEEFGNMLMAFEGFQFQLKLVDPGDDVDS
jgi:hypothetical protein